jgi:hypothetical protein
MFCMSFYVPVVAGETKLVFTAGTQATLTEVSACSTGAKGARLGILVNELPVMKESSTGKKGAPEVYGRPAFVAGDLYHIKKGDIVELVLKGDDKTPVVGVTIVLTLA